eukprot:TRINITY_DN1307_c0_g2_i9.p1 TRINITY_DN1307_c0_g2~~TRINITY_DN1307_c0_g2_i9.p1  ORF type:complete len:315 (+),score=22.67 TRINITY_DN1307_c0_g2_i9:199-1143(+)
MSQFKTKVLEFLYKNSTEILECGNGVIQIDSRSPILDAFEVLLNNNILSAPVWDALENIYTGFLDIRDLVSWVVFLYDEQKLQDNTRLLDLVQHGMSEFRLSGDGVTLSYLSRRHRFQAVEEGEPLMRIVQLLATGMHRVPVVKDGRLIKIISQTTIVRAITKSIPGIIFDHSADLTIAGLNVGTKTVLQVTKETSVIETLRKMDKNQRSGIAIVDHTGRIVGTTTGKDLGLFIRNPSLGALQEPIFDYLKHVRALQIDIRAPLITVFPTDKLTRAVALLGSTRIHRVFVVNNDTDFVAIGVVSITDILKFLIQ